MCLRLPTISLFPPEVTEEMERRFAGRLTRLDETGRLAVATAILEGRVTNERLQELTETHPRDITFLLKRLVAERFLVGNDKRRWSSYCLPPEIPVSSHHKEGSSQHKEESFHHTGSSFHHNDESFHHNEMEPEQEGEVVPAFSDLIRKIRGQRRIRAGEMEAAILSLGVDRYITAQELAEILQRSAVTIKNHYIARLVAQGKMEPRFPEQPTHPAQAYRVKVGDKDKTEQS